MSDKNFKLINAPATPFYKRSTAEIAAKILPQDKTFPYGNVKRQAMASDDTTDGTSAFNDTLAGAVQGSKGEQRIPIVFPSGVGKYVMGDPNALHFNDLQGNGATIEALAGAATVLRLGRETHDLWRYRTVSGLYIRGNAQASDGITFDDDGNTGSNDGPELAGRWVIDSVFLENCDKAIHKPKGNLGNIFRNVTTAACNFGYFAKDSDSPNIMHPGMDHFYGGRHAEHDLAAMYFSSDTQSTVGMILDGVVIEDNVAFGIYVDGWNLASTAFHMRSVVFENNNTGSANVDLGQGQGSEAPRDIFFRDVDHAIITGSHCRPQGWEFINSMVTLDGCFFDAGSVLIQDADSVVRCINANLNGIDGGANVIIESLTQQRRSSQDDGVTMVARIPPRDNIVYSLSGTGVGVYSQTFAHREVKLSAGTLPASRVESHDSGNGLYGWHNSYSLDDNFSEFDELIPLVLNKWYVYTVSIMVTSGEIQLLDFQNTDFFLAVNLDSPLRSNVPDGEWTTIGGVTQYIDASGSGNVRLRLARTDDTATVVNLGPAQCIQFDTQGEAIDYFNSKSFWQNNTVDEWSLETADFVLTPFKKANVTTGTTLTATFPINLMVDDWFIIHCESASTGTVTIDPGTHSFKGAGDTVTSSDDMTLDPGETIYLVAVSTSVMEVV